MALSLVHQVLNTLFAPVPENLFQIPLCSPPQHFALLLSLTLPFPLDELLEVGDSPIDEIFPWCLAHTFAEDVPPHGHSGHLVSNVSWVVDEFEDGVGSVIPLAVAVFVDTSVTPRSVGITFGKLSKYFGDERRLEDESVRFPVRWQVALLAQSDHLRLTRQTQRTRGNKVYYTFSARRAVSRAFGSVVLICSCSNSDVTKFLVNGQRIASANGAVLFTSASAYDATRSLRIFEKRHHASWSHTIPPTEGHDGGGWADDDHVPPKPL